MLNDTICAISTSLSNGAISIIRMSGEDSFEIIKKIAHLKDEKIKPNHIIYGHIFDNEEIIDEVMISFFKAPKSFTREDMVEINCHGGIYVTKTILQLVVKEGARLADKGEFSKRAYLNGRINLTQAESINDLINAKNNLQGKSAIKGVSGSIGDLLKPFMEDLKELINKIQVNIDYPEYEDEIQIINDDIKDKLVYWQDFGKVLLNKSIRFNNVKNGIKTAIVGKPNVGKSSLLNALINEDKAIVTDIAGTTRDIVEGEVILDNVTLSLIDTAGIRDSEDTIERIGIEKSKKIIEDASLVLVVLDSNNINDEDKEIIDLCKDKNYILVYNKNDLVKKEGISISALNGDIKKLVDKINEMYSEDYKLQDDDLLNNDRQIGLFRRCLDELDNLLNMIDVISIDIAIINLESAYNYLAEIIGLDYREDLIDNMFKKFCLGK